MAPTRRAFLASCIALCACFAPTAWANPGPHPHPHKRKRRRIRRRVRRRRIRRRVRWRSIAGRRRLVVPLAIAVGWELAMPDRVVVVKEVHEHTLVVENPDGSTETLEIAREDTDENSAELEGTEYEVEVEVEEDEPTP